MKNNHRYKAIVAYDGTAYSGWQQQPDLPTIAGTLEHHFQRIFKESISVHGVSRTDAGVHARGQIVVFSTQHHIPPAALKRAWNNGLPADIHIRSIRMVDPSYNPHADLQYKVYHYVIFTRRPGPKRARFGWFVRNTIDQQLLRDVLCLFVGTHDFRSFSTGDERGTDTVRTIESIEVIPLSMGYRIVVKGKKFLRYMIRRLMGAAVFCATRTHITLDDVRIILAQKNPCHTLPTAPAHGLELYKVVYD